MFPESLRLKGFRGIRDGMGLDEIHLDFEKLAPGAELVALAGPNGKGKTTIMDNLHPFPVMPSRAGQDGLGRFSYYDQLCMAEAEKDLVWRHDGRRFRSHLVFRMNGKRKTEAYLLEWRVDRWMPVDIEDGTVSDGKMETYWRCIVSILGSPETFFTSQFSAQGRQPLSSYTSASIKTLFAELLGHAEILRMSGRAAEVAKLLRAGLQPARMAQSDTEREVATSREAKAQLAAALDGETAARRGRDAAQARMLETRDRLTATKTEAAGDGENLRRRAAIRAAITEADRNWEAATTRLKEQQSAEIARKQAVDRRRTARATQAATARQQLEQRRHTLATVVAGAGLVRRAARRLDLTRLVLGERERIEADALARMQRTREVRAAADALRKDIEVTEREAGRFALQTEDLKRRLGLTDEVPCKGTDMQGHCKLLGDATAARAMLPSARQTLDRLQAERAAASSKLQALEVILADLAGASGALDMAEHKRVRTGASLQRRDKLASRQDDLQRAMTELENVERQIAGLSTKHDAPTGEETDDYRMIDESLRRIHAALSGEDGKRADARRTGDEQLAALPAPFDPGLLKSAEEALRQAQDACANADGSLTHAVQRVQTLRDAAGRLESLESKMGDARRTVEFIERKITVWTLLAKALGNDGVVALSIDDAGPTLSALANDLLLGCYGPRFTVSLITQIETAKGEKREGFSIVVHDAESGQSKLLENTSGGERVWINECLTRAIALYLTQSGGRHFQTLFSDEADGALDPDRKRMYMQLKRTVLRVGGYAREFFISQTPELTAMADAVIDLETVAAEQVA